MEEVQNCSSCTSKTVLTWTVWVVDDIAIPVLSIIGIVTNILAVIVLYKAKTKSTFHQSLIALAICDVTFLSFILLGYIKDMNYQLYVILFPYILNPGTNIMLCWETFLTMSISTERCLAVCKPFVYQDHKLRSSPRTHLLAYVIPPFLISVIINIPKFLEAKLVIIKNLDDGNRMSERMEFAFTSLRLNPSYIYYYTHWTRLVLTGIIPFLSLIFMNVCIFLTMRKTKIFKKQYQTVNNSRKRRNEIPRRSLVTLFVIVIFYLVFNTPRLVLNCMEYYLSSVIAASYLCPCSNLIIWLEFLLAISSLSLVINSSFNILIYICFSASFKNMLLPKRNEDEIKNEKDHKDEENLKNEDDLKNEDNLKSEDVLKNEDKLKDEEDLKDEDNIKNGDGPDNEDILTNEDNLTNEEPPQNGDM